MAKGKAKDQHKSGFLVRLPEAYRELLQKLKAKTDRPITASVRRGVDKELRENGLEPPSSEVAGVREGPVFQEENRDFQKSG